jgi:hypothetical protein
VTYLLIIMKVCKSLNLGTYNILRWRVEGWVWACFAIIKKYDRNNPYMLCLSLKWWYLQPAHCISQFTIWSFNDPVFVLQMSVVYVVVSFCNSMLFNYELKWLAWLLKIQLSTGKCINRFNPGTRMCVYQ